MKVRNNPVIEIRKHEHLVKVFPDGNRHHEANVSGYDLYVGKTNYKTGVGPLTLDDLKELRRVIRKVIRNESH